MPLVRRVSLYFLAALAVCLIGYSLALYALVSDALNRQLVQERQAALNTLAAAIEAEDDDVKWQPEDHAEILSGAVRQNHLRWAVTDDAGYVIDHSRNFPLLQSSSSPSPILTKIDRNDFWEEQSVTLHAAHPKPSDEREPGDYPSLTVTVATSSLSMRSTLWRLGLTLAGLSLVLWLIAAGVGVWYCRRALWPLMHMLAEVRSTTQADFHLRLSVSPQHDELAELATAFNHLLSGFQSAFDRQRQFAGNAAHQLRTPLTVMRGQLDVGLRRERSAQEYRTTLQVTQEQTLNLQQIVESLLFLTQPAEDMPRSLLETHAVKSQLTDVLSHWESHSRWSDLHLRIDQDFHFETAWPLLAQVLDNLVDNALKYSSPGSPVTIAAHQDATGTTLSVTDHGFGIATADQPLIFDPFFRSAAARSSGAPGQGLGLPLAAQMVRVLGGQIAITSEAGQGTTFTLSFPPGTNPEHRPPISSSQPV